MKILYALKEFNSRATPIYLAAGCFDGLHIGHMAVIQTAIDQARASGGEAWIYTFTPHPAKVLNPNHAPPLLYTNEQMLRCLQKAGIDGCILDPFTKTFTEQEPTDFFDSLCLSIPELAGISVGENWSFGRNRTGNTDLLTTLCAQQNLAFAAHPTVCWNGTRVSSTRLREAVRLGQLSDLRDMLGRPYSTIGTVIQGEKIGRKLGFPTANIAPENEIMPPRGIYAAQLRIGHKRHNAAAYIGHRGTFHQNQPQVLEVHLIDSEPLDLYGQHLEVFYHQFIRGDHVFESPDQLRVQIIDDLKAIRHLLA